MRSLAIASEGTVASGDWSGEIRLWDLPSWAAKGGKGVPSSRVLTRQSASVGSLSISPDGKWLASSAAEGPSERINHVYDLASGQEIATYRGHVNTVFATAISPDGRWAATGGFHGEIDLWDPRSEHAARAPRLIADGRPLRLAGEGRTVWATGFGQDGRSVAWGTEWQRHDPGRGYGPIQHALALPSAEASLPRPTTLQETAASAYGRASATHDAWSLTHRKGGAYGYDAILNILRDGNALASIERDTTNGLGHFSYTFTPDGETIIYAGNYC